MFFLTGVGNWDRSCWDSGLAGQRTFDHPSHGIFRDCISSFVSRGWTEAAQEAQNLRKGLVSLGCILECSKEIKSHCYWAAAATETAAINFYGPGIWNAFDRLLSGLIPPLWSSWWVLPHQENVVLSLGQCGKTFTVLLCPMLLAA